MSPAAKHLLDDELIALLDAEQLQSASAMTHLAVCPACRERQQQLAAASAAVRKLYRHGPQLSPAEPARLRLRHAVQTRESASEPQLPRWSYAAAALLLAAGLLLLMHRTSTPVQAAEIVPNRQFTPGAIRPVALDALCTAADDDQDPAVSPEIKTAVLREYGLSGAREDDYQIDYLINPQLGGTADVRNLWPEPYHSTTWNARAKDALESRLHQMVCRNQIGLASAQREIASDWIAAYKKYFHTARPLS